MIENYIGWPVGVSKVILSDTSITMGENATNTDNLESGGKRTDLKGGYISDKFSVVMEFEWESPMSQSDPKTEYQHFCEWYKYKHKFGSIPFCFPKILYSPYTGIVVLDDRDEPEYYEYYKITSGISNAQRSGSKIRITMTWETVYGGTVQITQPSLDSEDVLVSATSKYVDVTIVNIPNGTSAPVSGDITVSIDDVSKTIKAAYFDDETGNMRLWFNEVTTAGEHSVDVTVNYESLVNVTKSTTFEV